MKPPRCPNCGMPLYKVGETSYETYTWNPETGSYSVDGTLETKCLNCGVDLYDVFPEGVCNYRHEEG